MVGQRLGHFRIVEKIGAGGMGEVYRAHDEQLDRPVAIKVLLPESFRDAEARARLLREARSAAGMNHPHICTIYEVGEAEGQAYIAMELVEGRPLSALTAEGPLPVEQAQRFALQLADALGHAHDRGLVHRDLKSANVVITPEGRAKVLDFGLARRLSEAELDDVTRSQMSMTAPGVLVGTLAYMAPEQLRGRPADARGDVWALGVVLYETLTGARPFQGQTGFELSSAILNRKFSPLPASVPRQMRAVIERCLAESPEQRYQRGGEVRAALEAMQTTTVPVEAVWRAHLASRRGLALLAAAVVALAILAGLNVGGFRNWFFGGGALRIESLAVLPLENLSGDPAQDYFVEGMHEELIATLAQVDSLKVISRTSAMRYKNVHKPLPEIARELGVQAIVEGSVRRSGNQIRVTVHLSDAAAERTLWTRSYQRDFSEILALQSEIATAIAVEVRIQLGGEKALPLGKTRRVDPEAHEAYLKGRFFWNKFTAEGVTKAVEYFQQSIAKDPTYAPAYAGLSDSLGYLGAIGEVVPPRDAMPQARAAARQALEIDPELGEAHVALARVQLNYEWDWKGAGQAFERALQLSPSYAEGQHWFSHYLTAMSRTAESLAASRRALELDPLDLRIVVHLAWHHLQARQYPEAIEACQKTLQMEPNFWWAHYFLGLAYEQSGKMSEAITELEKARQLQASPASVGGLAHAYALAGRRSEAIKLLEELRALSSRRYVPPYEIAVIYAGLGDTDQALEWLEKAHQDRSGWLAYLRAEPRLDSLRNLPRFQELQRRMNFPPKS